MKFNRREFFKFLSLFPITGSRFKPNNIVQRFGQKDTPNVLLILFDTFSAKNMSLYGYPRNTTPLIEQLAEKAIVYHNHYAGGPFTTPGTTSLLTGMYPFTHRAVNAEELVYKPLRDRNIFNYLADDCYKIAYTHNSQADTVIRQFDESITEYVPRQELYLMDYWVNDVFSNDFDLAFVSVQKAIEDLRHKVTNSLYFPFIHGKLFDIKKQAAAAPYRPDFPRGLPNVSGLDFILEDAMDWVSAQYSRLPHPFFAYFHFLPPHDPYNTRKDFLHRYLDDGFTPSEKPLHPLTYNKSNKLLLKERRYYDEFINYVDAEFYRLFSLLEAQGALENTWIILTSDHGEMLERGLNGHFGPTLHEPVIHIPLLIFPPGQNERVDIYDTTSAIDILPTMLEITGQSQPEWTEGMVLPPFSSGQEIKRRSVYALSARINPRYKPFNHATVMLIENRMKMMYYYGYDEFKDSSEYIELYDLENDPEELNNLYHPDIPLARQMRDKIISRLEKENEPYN